ncbi:PIG-L family deacetylase [Ovoidimarina sediminis]|uniref:PIG-L family deacetylase n=1 Tax=Ovoidimarina sediminis TaxID=3079856 RepID=UPI002912927B|nr:PIG-L family deacetylase [Rhodophyticola sp. MJ-SS7]MDU8946216.1 PIG-L family deacetylase [Rhodophyticola sp. MJ-SS7]
MPTQDQSLLDDARARPRISELWRALRPLATVIRFMQSGAHPDDETSDMLAALAFRDGINLSYACSTRGEGGQNDIGTEAGADLGTLRTREMERACDILGMRMYWHSDGPDDPITDFGFSKSGEETLARWGEERTLARFVEIVRTDRPDILCPTFLDIGGQHGHHRAMTRAAHQVMAAAADPGVPSNLPPWQVKKLYLPAWSGAGRAYDDDAPPPPATLTIDGAGRDSMTGWTWAHAGQMSRAFHRTQGMGRWPAPDEARDWPLHLAESHVPGPDTALFAGLPRTLADLAALDGAAPIADPLRAAQAAIDTALGAFPAFEAVADALGTAHDAVARAIADCPAALAPDLLHRLEAKRTQLAQALRHARGSDARARVADPFLRPGEAAALTLEAGPGEAPALDLPAGWQADGGTLTITADAAPSDPYRDRYDPADPPAPALVLSLPTPAGTASARVSFDTEPLVLPAETAAITPEALILNLTQAPRPLTIRVTDIRPEAATPTLDLPAGWAALQTGDTLTLTPPKSAAPGLYELPLRLNGTPAHTVRRIAYPHIAPTARSRPATLRLRVLDAAVPDVRIGYAGAGNDRVGHWLAAMGANVTDLTDADLLSDATLAALDTIVIGIFALRFRPGLAEAMPRLHRWVRAGGTLVTLYHRPWDNWDPEQTPPYPLEIGQPSLRFRVTDETAGIRHLADHPILDHPNRIGPEDWADWVKERGLYFAKRWDAAYTPLLEMADPGEAPHRGALLVADVGQGRHVHTSLILHHQMEHLVPGAFRLMANLVDRRA